MASLFSEPGMCSCFVAAGGLLEPGACCDEAPVLVTILIEVMNPVTIYTADPCAPRHGKGPARAQRDRLRRGQSVKGPGRPGRAVRAHRPEDLSPDRDRPDDRRRP